MSDSLLFLHLSDIHMRTWSGSRYDLDEDLRRELLQDADRVVRQLGEPDGIFIAGDIAFGGLSNEYENARNWLGLLCETVGRNPTYVWCVPGNHDVDRSRVRQNIFLRDAHEKLRQVDLAELDERIREYMSDFVAREVMFSPLAEYNKFASFFECQIGHTDPTWHVDFALNDGSTLRVYGLNSTIISDEQDGVFGKVILGQFQVPGHEPGVANLVMCHHPPGWWRDADTVEPNLNYRVSIELFGHKHSQRLLQTNGTLRLVAGAVHPSRQEQQWKPCYNWIRLRVPDTTNARVLNVEVFPRVWSNDRLSFIPDRNSCDGQEFRVYSLRLEPWTPETARDVLLDPAVCGAASNENQNSAEQTPPAAGRDPAMHPARILTYRFFELSYVARMDIAQKLDLILDEDEGLHDFDLFERVFQRAREQGLLPELWDEIERRHGDTKYPNNPFSDA